MAEKFTSAEEYRDELLRCYFAMQMVLRLRLDDLYEAQLRAESVGPILDPTLYRANADKMAEDKRIVRALRKAVAEMPTELVEQFRSGAGIA